MAENHENNQVIQEELIPHLVEGIKEQQQTIDKQQKQIDILIDKMNKINKKFL